MMMKYEVYLINNFEISVGQIHAICLKRWQIEILIKQLQQNFEHKDLMGDNKMSSKDIFGVQGCQFALNHMQKNTNKAWGCFL